MEGVAAWLERTIVPPLAKIGNQRYFVALRAGLTRTIPLIIVGSIPLILANLPVASWAKAMEPYNAPLMVLFNMSFGFLGLFVAVSIGAELARMYELEITTASIVTVACFLITVAPVDLAKGTISIEFFGAKGMFTAFVVGVVVAEVMRFMRDRGWTIKMPAGVPTAISSSFAALFPLLVLLAISWLLRVVIGVELQKIIQAIVSPLVMVSDSLLAVYLVNVICSTLWFVGIHGGSLTIWGVLYPFLLANIAANSAAAAAGQPLPHIYTEPFQFTYAMPTGVGITLPLILFFWRSKSARLREVARVAIGPGIFNINEPVTFGMPLIMNPLMFIPFVFGGSALGAAIGYAATRLGLARAPYIQVPWTTPALIQPYLSTGGDFGAVLVQLFVFIVMAVMWYPFFRVYERRLVEEEQKAEAA